MRNEKFRRGGTALGNILEKICQAVGVALAILQRFIEFCIVQWVKN